jgi:hypothetical protein
LTQQTNFVHLKELRRPKMLSPFLPDRFAIALMAIGSSFGIHWQGEELEIRGKKDITIPLEALMESF